MIADDAKLERHAGMLTVADGGRHAGIRNGHHDIDLDVAFTRELRAKRLADFIHGSPAHDGIRPRKVDVLEDAGPRRLWRKRFMALRAVLVEYDDFAGLDVADIFRADDVERAGLRRQDRAAVEFAQHQRASRRPRSRAGPR
jgi:hypothetical protein